MKAKDTSPARLRSAKKKRSSDPPESQPATPIAAAASSNTRFLPWILVLVVILLAGAVRVRLLETPLERDEGEYAFAGQLLLQGTPPYREAFNLKFPGIYVAYAAIMGIFGQTIIGIHLGLLLLNAGTIVLVFLLGRRLFTAAGGVAACAAYALLSLGADINGTQAHATHFVVAAALGATLLLLRAIDTGSEASVFWSGLLYGIAILMKQHGIFFAMFGGLYLMGDQWRRQRGGWLAMCRKAAVFLLGATVPLALTALALGLAGTFGNFWFWTITYARQYVMENSLATGWSAFSSEVPQVVGPNLPIWILAAAGLAMLYWKPQDRATAAFATAFLVFSFLAVCPGFYFRGHYFVLLLPAVALLAGSAMVSAAKLTGVGPAYLVYGAALAFAAAQQSDFLFHLSPVEASRLMYGQNPFPEAIQIGAYLREHTAKDARVAVLGSEPEILFYAGRRSATGHIYTYGLMEPQPFALTMQNEMIRDIEKVRPGYVVFVNHPGSWLQRPNSSVRIFEWWGAYSAQYYKRVGLADILSQDLTDYRWENVAAYRPKSPLFVAVYKRLDP